MTDGDAVLVTVDQKPPIGFGFGKSQGVRDIAAVRRTGPVAELDSTPPMVACEIPAGMTLGVVNRATTIMPLVKPLVVTRELPLPIVPHGMSTSCVVYPAQLIVPVGGGIVLGADTVTLAERLVGVVELATVTV